MVALFSKGKLPMPDDDRDFIERANSVAEKLHGEPMTTEEIADSFALLDCRSARQLSKNSTPNCAARLIPVRIACAGVCN
jgi:hypothetical protein